MITLFGRSGSYLLFTDGTNSVVVDTLTNMVENIGSLEALSYIQPWNKTEEKVDSIYMDLASGALSDLQIETVVAAGRMYTIPKAVQEEAKKALEWRKEFDRGGTPVGLGTARILANGGQVGPRKIRHIAKYFPRHEVDKKGKGYKPGQDGFPSNGRIAWALWGGDAGWRWAKQIVERENNAVRASGASPDDYETFGDYDTNIDAFRLAHELSVENAPEFVARVRHDSDGIDRLYMLDSAGEVFVWDDGVWDDLGHTDSDILTFDNALDDPQDDFEKSHIFVDPDSALILSAKFQQVPFSSVTVDDLDEKETAMVAAAMEDIDWEFIDSLVAAGEDPIGASKTAANDGVYSPKERSANARKQVRDRGGKFAAMGSRVVVGNDPANTGRITGINSSTGMVTVQRDDGSSSEVRAADTQAAQDFKPTTKATPVTDAVGAPLDVTGILGQPRAPIDSPNATVPGGLPALTPDQLQKVLYDYPGWVMQQRSSANGKAFSDVKAPVRDVESEISKYAKQREKQTGVSYKSMGDLRKHPLFKNAFAKKPSLNLYYNPLMSSGEADVVVAKRAANVSTAKKANGLGKELTPQTSDVQPMYMAIVSPDDLTAVFDLVSIVPASTNSTEPAVYKRSEAKWVKDDSILADLKSATPPPVVPLDGDNLIEVLKQVDGTADSADANDSADAKPLTAEGGLDRNRGQAEKLRHYWLYGRGALKIRWNTPGDWTRCYHHLVKYMGIRAKGYCALRHKEATGVWPGSKFNIGKKKSIKASAAYDNYYVLEEDQIMEKSNLHARVQDARSRVLLADGSPMSDGASFTIPLVIPEDRESGDGRKFKKGAIEIRELPLPLLWQIKTADGHSGSVVVGRIDHMERTSDGIGNATGVFDTGAHGCEAERMVRNGFIRGVSADLDQFEANEESKKEAGDDSKDEGKIGGDKINITHARVMAVTIVPKPAFEECSIYINDGAVDGQEEGHTMIPDGIYVEDMDGVEAQSIVACGIIAGAIPVVPPATWFTNPALKGATPLTVDDNGRVFGHIAAWHVDHIGMAYGTRPPRSKSKYAYFHTGVVRADDGKDYQVGQLTLAGGHASLEASAVDAARHYDDTGSAIADVHAGEDQYGIWVAGSLRPSASPEQVRALRASAPSGDWRPIGGALELVAVCQVNVPGFPIARARVASGQVYALVAAGAQVLAKMKNDPITELSSRIATLEAEKIHELSAKAEDARSRFSGIRAEKQAELSAKADELSARIHEFSGEFDDEFTVTMRERRKLAKAGKALPDGSFPISNVEDLKNAIQSYGRATPAKRALVKRHIIKRARGLDQPGLIPEEWKSASLIDEEVPTDLQARVAAAKAVTQVAELKARVASALEGTSVDKSGSLKAVTAADSGAPAPEAIGTPDSAPAVPAAPGKFISGVNQPRDDKGKFRDVLARLKIDLGKAGLNEEAGEADAAERLAKIGNYTDAVAAASKLLNIVDRIDQGGIDSKGLEGVRSVARELGSVLANLPLPFGSDNEKLRYSDLPPVLKQLIDDMVDRVSDKIGAKDSAEATAGLRKFQTGSDLFSQSDVSGEMGKLMRLLT